MKVNGWTTRLMARVFTCIKMVRHTQANGSRICSTGMAFKSGLMELLTRGMVCWLTKQLSERQEKWTGKIHMVVENHVYWRIS